MEVAVRDADLLSEIRGHLGDTTGILLSYEQERGVLWVTFNYSSVPSFTANIVREVLRLRAVLELLLGRNAPRHDQPVRFIVFRSSHEKVFSLGGDIDFFLEAHRKRDFEAMRACGRAASEACYWMSAGFGCSAVTIALVHGSALGSGFEVSAACDFLVAEEGAILQMPEIKFSMFPGAGAVSLMSRRFGTGFVRRMVLESVTIEAKELFPDIVHKIAPKGMGTEAIHSLIDSLDGKFVALSVFNKELRAAEGVTLERMLEEADVWAGAMMALKPSDLDTMLRIVTVQKRKYGSAKDRRPARGKEIAATLAAA
jgi:DSF synthase